MITKTSLFNKGIYKSTVRRYLWGSVLYFVILFLVTSMGILLSIDPQNPNSWWRRNDISLILEDGFIIVPMLLAMVVPTVAGLLIFRFIHSKKTSVFVHSLPVKRTANFISSVLAGFTLMAAPVILNGLILMLISLGGYGAYFTIGDCVVWMLLNLLCLFSMFSCVCFVASLTGNSFAMVALNILIHTFVLIISAGLVMVSGVFLHGFADENVIFDAIFEHTFPVKLCNIMTRWAYSNGIWEEFGISIIKILIFSVVLYLLSAFLYKKRRMETAEDVAGFKCLNPIFKYLITFIGAISTFAVLSTFIREKQALLWLVVALVSAVIYFGIEMLLKKNFKVWKSYKGYLAFALAFALMMCVFAFTGFFGFETRLPEIEDIKAAGIYNYYGGEKPLFESDEIKSRTVQLHHTLIKDITTVKNNESYTNIHVEYALKNGKTLHRSYPVSDKELYEIMDGMYENIEYKKKAERIFAPMESLYRVNIHNDYGNYTHTEITGEEKMQELKECIIKDVEGLSYSEIYTDGWGISVEINYVPEESAEYERTYTEIVEDNKELRISYLHMNVNANYKNTIAWLKENGYWDKVSLDEGGMLCIAKDWENLIENDNCVIIEKAEDVKKVIEFIYTSPQKYISHNEGYYIYRIIDSESEDYRNITCVTKEQLKELLPEYNWDEI